MSTFLKILVPLWVVIMTGSAALADDLALITIENRYQADVVAGVVDRAYVRADNSFVVLLDARQKLTLERAGISSDVIQAEAETVSMYLVHPRQASTVAVPPDPLYRPPPRSARMWTNWEMPTN